MLRSRRFALVAVATILGLSACGDAGSTTSPGDAPAVIVLGAGGNSAAPEASRVGMAGADKAMFIGNISYVFDGTMPDLGDTGASWTLPAGTADAAAVARIAKVLGVAGEPRQLPAEQGGGWMVGPADYSDATVTVSNDGMVSWWYSPKPQPPVATPACAYPDKGVVDPATTDAAGSDAAGEADTPVAPTDAASGGSTDGSSGAGGAAVEPQPLEPCPAPEPPANVPTKAEAEAKAVALMKQLGLDPAKYELSSYADEWSANTTAWLLIDGHRSPLQFNVGFGGEGALQWASGTLAVPQPSSDYPLVTPAEALQRLNDQNGMWGGYYGGGIGIAGGVARDAVAPSAVGAAETVAGAAGTTDIAVAPPDSVLVDPMPPETVQPQDITVTLNAVRLDVTMVWAQDGTVWLLPAYTFTSTDGGEYTVIAVEDQYIQQPDPVTVDTTTPGDTIAVPPATEPGDTVAPPPVTDPIVVDTTLVTDPGSAEHELVGLSVDEATKVAADHGWTVRVVILDGESQNVTADYSPDRINVGVTGGVVTSIESRG